jgi:UDP-N-acetylglucosamine 1-carboxyvinyltransferase
MGERTAILNRSRSPAILFPKGRPARVPPAQEEPSKLVLEGGHPLEGTVRPSGSKNATLPLLTASLLTREDVVLQGAPELRDVEVMAEVLRAVGSRVERREDGNLCARTVDESPRAAPYELVRQMRGSFCVLGPLLARRGTARVSLPGGCVIGDRPVDIHLKGLCALGAELEVDHGDVVARAPRGLRGAEIYLGSAYGSTVLGTCNVMMAACLARGRSVIECAACEPEVESLALLLTKMGARVRGAGTHRIEIDGVEELHGASMRVIPDRIEAGTLLLAGLLTGGDVLVDDVRTDALAALLDRIEQAGGKVERGPRSCRARPSGRLRATDVTTLPYPGFPTDLQAPWLALMAVADGVSLLTERVFPDRFMHVPELNRLGARIRREGPYAVIQGVPSLSGAPVMASDLRASSALVLAGLVAKGRTEVRGLHHLDRGYERFEEKLRRLGARIERVSDPAAFPGAPTHGALPVRRRSRSPLRSRPVAVRP